MFSEAIAASDWETIEHKGYSFTFSCMKHSIICMEVCRDGYCVWHNPGPMMPGQWPEMLTQAVLNKLSNRLSKRYGEKIEWKMAKK